MRTLIASAGIVAALLMAPSTMAQQNQPFCLKSSPTAQPSCMFQTMAACEQAKGSNATAQCIPSSQAGTTGAGEGGMPKSSPSPSPTPSPSR
jgi:Protein of unknown function (DUF3551)